MLQDSTIVQQSTQPLMLRAHPCSGRPDSLALLVPPVVQALEQALHHRGRLEQQLAPDLLQQGLVAAAAQTGGLISSNS